SLIINIGRIKSREIIVYNSPKNTAMQLISGRKNYVVSQHLIESDINTFNLINKTKLKLKLTPPIYITKEDTLIDDFLFAKKGIIIFEGKSILFKNNISKLPKTISPDYIINPNQFQELKNPIFKNAIIITNKKFIQKENSFLTRIHQTSKEGAFTKKW
ncbi:MAG: hypothetical protein GQ525_11000, partial [Draconibacterium sp.]|nr:hypothetical protein [Draconibacterium sp.]